MAKETVITQIKQKNNDNSSATGYDGPYYLGAAARHVFGVRGAGVSNLENTLLLGCNVITTTRELQEGIYEITEEFKAEDVTENYFYIYTKKSTSGQILNKKQFYRDGIIIPTNDGITFTDDESILAQSSDGYNFDNETFTMTSDADSTSVNTKPIIEESKLYYIKNPQTEILVATRTIYLEEKEDGSVVQTQVIVDNLSS